MSTPGYGPLCKACNSQHRAEIDRRLLASESTRDVSEWLERAHSERIQFQALARHKLEHCNVLAEARARLAAAQPVHDAAAEKIVANVELLDELAGIAMPILRTFVNNPPSDMPGAVVLTGLIREVRQCCVARHEILHGKKVNLDGVGGLVEFLALGFDRGTKGEGSDPTPSLES